MVVAGTRVVRHFGSTLDRGLHLSTRLRLPICSPQNFHVERHITACQPRGRIQELHLDSTGAHRELQRRSDFSRIGAAAEVLDYSFVLVVDSLAKTFGAKFRRSSEFLVVGSLPMQNSPVLVHHGVYDRVAWAPVLGLHVEQLIAHVDVRVKSGTHRLPIASRPRAASRPTYKILGSSFDRCTLERYYSSAFKMNSNYLDSYGPLLLMFILAAGMAALLITLSSVIGKHKPTPEKNQPYECGIQPTGDARQPFSVHFYMVALVFILFDIEAIFLYPWALVYHKLNVFGFVEMLLYIVILLVGYIFLWKKGALNWDS